MSALMAVLFGIAWIALLITAFVAIGKEIADKVRRGKHD